MAFYDKFPYTNFQELNLDKIVNGIGEMDRKLEETLTASEAAETSANRAAASESAAAASAEAAAASAETAASDADIISGALDQIEINRININRNTAAIQTTDARIDSIITSGTATEGNTELIDIRTASDGITYSTAGLAVRTTTGNNALIERIEGINWIPGYIASNGQISQETGSYTSYTTQLMPCLPGDTFRINFQYLEKHLLWAAYAFYDENGTMVGSRTTCITGSNTTAANAAFSCTEANAKYIRISERDFGQKPEIFHSYASFNTSMLPGYLEAVRNNVQNLYNQSIKGIINQNGSIGAGDQYIEFTTDFIPCRVNQKFFQHAITDNPGWMAFCTYDAQLNGLARYTTLYNSVYLHDGFHTMQEFTVPAGAAYVRACTRTDGRREMTCVLEGYDKASDAWVKQMKTGVGNLDYAMARTAEVRSCSHRGMANYAPENTIPCFQLGRAAGFPFLETDVRFTSDHIPVMLHDETINRTARNTDGTELTDPVYIADITYAEARTYDFGIFKGSQFAGTRIPTLEETLSCLKRLGMSPILEIKAQATAGEMQTVIDLVNKAGLHDRTILQSFINANLNTIKQIDPTMTINKIGMAGTTVDIVELTKTFKTGQNSVGLNMAVDEVDNALAERCQAEGLRLECWTPNTYAKIKNLPTYVSAVYSDLLIASAVWYRDNID